MYDESLYEFDRNKGTHTARIANGGYLYRLTSIAHSGVGEILTGAGTLRNPVAGRFNSPMQQTSYCANNILVCIGEILYHMYRVALRRIEKRDPTRDIRESLLSERCLTVVSIDEINDLVYADAKDVTIDFDNRMCGTTVVFPDEHYQFLWDFNNRIRRERKRGVFYPSARHSRDLCIALFYDETSNIRPSSYRALDVQLQLLAENQDLALAPRRVDPFSDKLHPTMGYYSFHEPNELEQARIEGILNPGDLPPSGKVDFVRRYYSSYPDRAVCV